MILLEDINSYPEMCAERVLPRSTSTPPIPVSAFFTAFFHSRARASSTGRGRHCIGIWVFLIQL